MIFAGTPARKARDWAWKTNRRAVHVIDDCARAGGASSETILEGCSVRTMAKKPEAASVMAKKPEMETRVMVLRTGGEGSCVRPARIVDRLRAEGGAADGAAGGAAVHLPIPGSRLWAARCLAQVCAGLR